MPPRAGVPAKSSAGAKPYSLFIVNLLNQQAITTEMAETLHRLPNPPLQFQAMMRLRQNPGKSLGAIVQEILTAPPELPRAWQGRGVHPPRTRLLDRRWVIKAGLGMGLVLLVYACWKGAVRLGPARHPAAAPAPAPVPAAPSAEIQTLAPMPIPVPAQFPAPPPASRRAWAPSPSLPPPAPSSAEPALKAPAHFTAALQAHGFVHMSWETAAPAGGYRLYSALSEDLRDHRTVQQDLIPMPWWDWMPPEGPMTVWLAVSQILPDGQESPLSRPVLLHIP